MRRVGLVFLLLLPWMLPRLTDTLPEPGFSARALCLGRLVPSDRRDTCEIALRHASATQRAPLLERLAHAHLAQGAWQEGKDAALASLAAEPDRAAALAILAEAALRLGDAALARRTLDRLIASHGADPNRLAARAEAAARLGDPHAALRDLDDALAADPEHRLARILRAQVQLAIGAVAAARADIAVLAERFPDDRHVRRLRAALDVAEDGAPAWLIWADRG